MAVVPVVPAAAAVAVHVPVVKTTNGVWVQPAIPLQLLGSPDVYALQSSVQDP